MNPFAIACLINAEIAWKRGAGRRTKLRTRLAGVSSMGLQNLAKANSSAVANLPCRTEEVGASQQLAQLQIIERSRKIELRC
jgi:hypothetical protein